MKPIYILGDHHGDYEGVFSVLSERGIRDATVIHVGDGAEGFPDWRATTAESLDKRFAALGIQYLSIRGNHSDPAFFDGSVMLPNFKLLCDFTTLHLNGQSWLLVGGAISIDRIDRVLGRTWWPGEAFVLRDARVFIVIPESLAERCPSGAFLNATALNGVIDETVSARPVQVASTDLLRFASEESKRWKQHLACWWSTHATVGFKPIPQP
jgi:hypothetical protein